jgi:hypothetical protein
MEHKKLWNLVNAKTQTMILQLTPHFSHLGPYASQLTPYALCLMPTNFQLKQNTYATLHDF